MSRRRVLSPEQISEAISLYTAGAKLAELAAQFSCSEHAICDALKAQGINRRPAGRRVPNKPTPDVLKRLYIDERQSSTAIGRMFGTNWGTICEWLRECGIPVRSASEAKRLDMERWSHEERLKITEASRAIIEEKPRSREDRAKRAKGVQRKARLSPYEATLFSALRDKGLHPIPQFAIDKFNIDLAFPEQFLAIELHGGCWHNTPKKKAFDEAKRLFIEPLGWRILVIRARRKRWVDEAVALIIHQLLKFPLLIAREKD